MKVTRSLAAGFGHAEIEASAVSGERRPGFQRGRVHVRPKVCRRGPRVKDTRPGCTPNVEAAEAARAIGVEDDLAAIRADVGTKRIEACNTQFRHLRWRLEQAVGLAIATLLLLLAVAIGSPVAAWRIAAARDAESHERQRAEQNADELVKSCMSPTCEPPGRQCITELASGKRIDSLKGSRICIDGVGLTSDAKTLATRTVDEAMNSGTWPRARRSSRWGRPKPGPFLPLSPNGEYLAITWASGSRGERRVELWRAPSFEEIIAAERSKARKD